MRVRLPEKVAAAIAEATAGRTGRALSAESVRTYTANLTSLFGEFLRTRQEAGAAPPADLLTEFVRMALDVRGTAAIITARSSNGHTQMGKISALMRVFGLLQELRTPRGERALREWTELQRALKDTYETHRDSNKLSEKQKAKYIEMPRVRAIFNENMLRFRRGVQAGEARSESDAEWALFVKRLLILALYAVHPPTRQDYGCVRLYRRRPAWAPEPAPANPPGPPSRVVGGARRAPPARSLPQSAPPARSLQPSAGPRPAEPSPAADDDEPRESVAATCGSRGANYIVLPSETLVLGDYKTAEMYGRIESRLPPEVMEILRESLRLEPRRWLFTKADGRPYSASPRDTNSFTALVNRSLSEMLGQPADVTTLRRSFASWLASQPVTFAERRRAAEIMGHSVLQNMKYQVVGGALHIENTAESVPLALLSPADRAAVEAQLQRQSA